MINSKKMVCCREIKYFGLGIIALILGLLIYLLFRPNTYVSIMVSRFFSFETPKFLYTLDCSFTKFYLVDYLWAFSFGCCLNGIFINGFKKQSVFAIVSIVGITYEVLQFFGVISGTGDILDCLLYLLAGWTVNILNI